jgi:hypothetical protein
MVFGEVLGLSGDSNDGDGDLLGGCEFGESRRE